MNVQHSVIFLRTVTVTVVTVVVVVVIGMGDQEEILLNTPDCWDLGGLVS